MSSNANHTIAISTIKAGDRGRCKNQIVSWAKFCEKLSWPQVDEQHTHAQYLALGVDEKNKAKDVGSYVLGQFDGEKRKRENVRLRSAVSLDIDEIDPGQFQYIREGWSELAQYEFFATTTRSHTTVKPKTRLIFPTVKPIPAEHYAAVSRILSSKLFPTIEESMDAVDDVSHRVAQIMYWTSRSKDQEFKSYPNHGELLDHEALLAAYPGWEDHTKLPFSPTRGNKRPGQLTPAERPNLKKGLVGAFCRAYSVVEAMEEFIPGVYIDPKKEGRDLRYTYAKGHGSKGAIVYDEGLFLYSHHGTDPCGERNVNAFDMVRLHLYGDQDKKDDGGTASQQPSWKAMEELVRDDVLVKQELLSTRLDVGSMFDNLADPEPEQIEVALVAPTGEVAPALVEPEHDDSHDDLLGPLPGGSREVATVEAIAPAPQRPGYDPILDENTEFDDILGTPKTDWLSTLDIGEKGEIKSNLTNVAIVLKNDPRVKGAIAHNEFTDEIVLRKPMALNHATSVRTRIADPMNGDHWQDRHDASLRILLEAARGAGQVGYGLKVSQRDLKDAVENTAHANSFNPVKEIWESVTWDGTERLSRLFIDYLGAADNAYHREVAVKTLVALVTRVYEPGHKFDFMPILEGVQGIRKSTFLRELSMGFFAEMAADFDDAKKAIETMRGALIVEMGELTQFNRSEVNTIKAFVSRDFDKARMAYARHETIFKRRSIFCGSTNEDTYLRDNTGNRRFWPIKTNVALGEEIDTDKLKREIPQLYAEALVYYRRLRVEQPKGNLPLFLKDDARKEALRLQETRRVETDEDVRAGMIEAWLNKPIRASNGDGLSDETHGFDEVMEDGTTVKPGMVLRDRTCMFELFVECLGGDRNRFNNVEGRSIKNSMRRIPGWSEMGRVTFPNYGQQRVYVRSGTAYEAQRKLEGFG